MPNIAFWIKSLQSLPSVSKTQWSELDIISRWLVATRSAVFIMTAISCLIGGLFAFNITNTFNWTNFLLCFIGLIFAHASNNLINDFIDYKKGVDKNNYYRSLYGPQILEHQLVKPGAFYMYFGITLLIAILSGVYLVYRTDITTLYIMLIGVLLLIFYTWPLKYIGLGESSVNLVWGPLMVGGAFYVTSSGYWSWDIIYIGIVYAIGPTSVLFGKHIDKWDQDKVKRVYTLPVILGEKAARNVAIIFWIIQYVVFTILVIKGILGFFLLFIFFAIPEFISTVRKFLQPKPKRKPRENEVRWPLYFASYAFLYNRRFSVLFLLGLILDIILTKLNLI